MSFTESTYENAVIQLFESPSDYNPCRCRRKSGDSSECADETYTRGKV